MVPVVCCMDSNVAIDQHDLLQNFMRVHGFREAAHLHHRQGGGPPQPTYALNSKFGEDGVNLTRPDTILFNECAAQMFRGLELLSSKEIAQHLQLRVLSRQA